MSKIYRPIPTEEMLTRMPDERCKKIDARAAVLIAEEQLTERPVGTT